jgi:hypothetical protein
VPLDVLTVPGVLAPDDVAEDVARLEPPHAASSATAARVPRICVESLTFLSIRGD